MTGQSQTAPIVFLGYGMVASTIAARCAPDRIRFGTTRRPVRAAEMKAAGVEPILIGDLSTADRELPVDGADVVASFPPDGFTDALLAPRCRGARRIVYISSTAVYGNTSGIVDDRTPARATDFRSELRLAAEAVWKTVGATVLRPPGVYGQGNGLHVSLRSGTYRLPGDGSNVISRIHVEDLAALVLAALDSGRPADTYVVGDATPVPQREVVAWLCERMGLALPPSAPLDAVPVTMRGNRLVDGSRALRELAVELKYPSYREGFGALIAPESA